MACFGLLCIRRNFLPGQKGFRLGDWHRMVRGVLNHWIVDRWARYWHKWHIDGPVTSRCWFGHIQSTDGRGNGRTLSRRTATGVDVRIFPCSRTH